MIFESLDLICPRAQCCRCCLRYRSEMRTNDAGNKGHVTGMPAKLTRVRLRRHAVRIHRPFPYFTDSTCVRQELFWMVMLRYEGNEKIKKIKARGLISTIWTCSPLLGSLLTAIARLTRTNRFQCFRRFMSEIFVTFIKKDRSHYP